MNERVLVKADAETAAQMVTAILARQGYRVSSIFDLRSTLTSQPDRVCPCQGTVPCTCQLVLLLVYADIGEPVSVIAHGHKAETILRIVDDPAGGPNPELDMQVAAAMIEAALTQGVTTDGR